MYRPLREGVIADYRVTQAMIRHFLKKARPKFWPFRPEVVVSVPAGITSTEQRAVVEAATSAGAKNCYVVKEPILAAIGAGLPINSHAGHMIVNIGGGTAEIAVISLGGIVVAQSVRVAGDKLDAAIAAYVKSKHNLLIGDQTAERIKTHVGTALPVEEEKSIEIKGRDVISGLPRNVTITSNEVASAIGETLQEILTAVKQVLRDTPPELAGDIMERGLTISGGGGQLPNIADYFTQQTGVPAAVAEDSLRCVAKGAGTILDNLEVYKKSLMSSKR